MPLPTLAEKGRKPDPFGFAPSKTFGTPAKPLLDSLEPPSKPKFGISDKDAAALGQTNIDRFNNVIERLAQKHNIHMTDLKTPRGDLKSKLDGSLTAVEIDLE